MIGQSSLIMLTPVVIIIIIITILFVSPPFFKAPASYKSLTLLAKQLRLLYILPATNPRRPLPRKRGSPTHLLIVLGSGGHTAEMLALLADLDPNLYNRRTYVISAGDDFSAIQAISFEQELTTLHPRNQTTPSLIPPPLLFQTTPEHQQQQQQQQQSALPPPPPPTSYYSLHFVPRARKIHQPLLTTPFSSLRCLIASIFLLHSLPSYPDLILLNGPATSTILLFSALILRVFDWRGVTTRGKFRSIYIESWARVRRLSLSARIITSLGAADRVLVQWEGLAGRGEYRGCLIR